MVPSTNHTIQRTYAGQPSEPMRCSVASMPRPGRKGLPGHLNTCGCTCRGGSDACQQEGAAGALEHLRMHVQRGVQMRVGRKGLRGT